MEKAVLLELFGYLGSALVVISMLMSSIVKLRIVNTVGSVVSGIYAVCCHALPLAIMNFCLIVINVWGLLKLLRSKKPYSLVESSSADGLVQYFIGHYRDDIAKYFPAFSAEAATGRKAYIVCCDGNPAGLLLGEENDGELDILLDYSTPVYRDCSVGKYLYSRLGERGLKSARFAQQLTETHRSYLENIGFTAADGAYIKNF